MLCCAVLCYGMLWYAMKCLFNGMIWLVEDMVCYLTLCVMLWFVMLWYACYVMLRVVMLCCAMVCYGM